MRKEIIGEPLILNGRKLSLSPAVRAGDFVFLTGQLPLQHGKPMGWDTTIEEQTHRVLQNIRVTLQLADCDLQDVVKTMVWLCDSADFPGFNQVYGEYFTDELPARSAVIATLLLDVRLEIEVIAYKPKI